MRFVAEKRAVIWLQFQNRQYKEAAISRAILARSVAGKIMIEI